MRKSSAGLMGMLISSVGLAGCVGGPTYGTGTPANVQLLSDISNITSLGGNREEPIDYNPRPELVEPPAGTTTLPPVQEDVTRNEAWPESPEERRRRIREYATENRDKAGYRPLVSSDSEGADEYDRGPDVRGAFSDANSPYAGIRMEDDVRRAEIARRQQIANQGSPTQRRYLSEPPLDYRRPADTAAVGELGEDEDDKEKRREKALGKGGIDLWPF